MNDRASDGVHVVKVPDIGEGIAEVELVAWYEQFSPPAVGEFIAIG